MIREDKLQEKKLRGSGGYAIANVTDEEQRSGNLGGPELFLAGVGRLQEERFSKYYCNKCEKQYDGPPKISYENPNGGTWRRRNLNRERRIQMWRMQWYNCAISKVREMIQPHQLK